VGNKATSDTLKRYLENLLVVVRLGGGISLLTFGIKWWPEKSGLSFGGIGLVMKGAAGGWSAGSGQDLVGRDIGHPNSR
jgi:hypothetical protein